MKLTEIMIIKEDLLKIFNVDDATLSRLVCVRGNLYRDDPRLRTMAVTQSQTPDIDPERQAWLDGAYARYLAEQAAKATPAAIQPQPMTFEEQLSYDWRFNPGIRKEFISYDSFLAYKRAEKSGKAKCYGRG